MQFCRHKKFKLVLATSIVLLLLAIIFAGCLGTSTPAKGWSGVAISDGKLFIGSQTGKLVGIEEDTGSRLFNDLSLETGSSGGFLGCGAAPVTVAIYGTPIVSGNQVFVAGYNGKVYSLDATKGIKGWAFIPERGSQQIIGGLALDQNALFFGTTSGYIYSIDMTTSAQNWEVKTGGKIWATPLIDNGILYIGSFDKKLYAIDTNNGEEKWQFETGGAIVATPVLKDNILYFGTLDRYFYAVDATNGNLKWKSAERADKWFWANPLIVNDTVYAPNTDGKVYIINLKNGQSLNTPLVIGSPISSSPVIVGNTIILGAQDGTVWAINSANNVLNKVLDKSIGKIYAPLSTDQDIVFIHTQDNYIHVLKINPDNTAQELGWSPKSLAQ